MKRRTKKIKAKLELLELAGQHAFLDQHKRVAELIDIIDDTDFARVVANFILAKQEMELALEDIKKDVAPYLEDDSDF